MSYTLCVHERDKSFHVCKIPTKKLEKAKEIAVEKARGFLQRSVASRWGGPWRYTLRDAKNRVVAEEPLG